MHVRPTRRITKSHCSVTGKKPSKKTGFTHRFESALERDYITLLEFDDQVDSYVEQPFTIRYFYEGKNRIYTPDFFVVYKQSAHIQPLVSEIKYTADLQLHQTVYERKFNAATQFAQQNGYRFSIITEQDIRTPRLHNAAFLNRYIFGNVDTEHHALLSTRLSDLQQSTPEALITACCSTALCKEELLYSLWQLVATKQVGCDLNMPLTMHSKIWINAF